MNHSPEHESDHSYSELAEEARTEGAREQADLLKEAWSEAAGHSAPEQEDAPTEASSTPAAGDAPLAAEIAELKDQLLRAVAETENVRRRAQRDVEEAGKYAVASFAREIVGVCDNLWRAAEAVPKEARQGSDLLATIAQGVDMTLQELMNVLERFHVKRVDPLGQMFDHNLHQAVVQIEHPEAAPGTILQVMQAGYTLRDRLLRPAMVGVAKRPETPTPPPSDTHIDTQA